MKGKDDYAEKMFESYADVVNVEDLCFMLGGISKKLAYRLLSDGTIKSIRVGRAYKIPKLNVRKYLLQQESLK
jgi:excisionase family DNA binding protein